MIAHKGVVIVIAHATKMVALARSRQYMHIFPIDASRNSPVTILSQIIMIVWLEYIHKFFTFGNIVIYGTR